MKQREARHKTCLAAEMRLERERIGVHVLNISARGMVVQCRTAPARGDYVEITRGVHCVIGRIIWSRGGKCGLRTQDRIDIDAFVDTARTHSGSEFNGDAQPAFGRAAAPEERLARSQRFATIMQFGFLAVGGVAAAMLLANSAHRLLSAPLEQVARALSGRG
jgi:hypothetical protein